MKLRFEQVLEYLESGEKDPEFGQFLKDHPDGPRMLQEAKLLQGLLGHQAAEDTDDADEAGPDVLSLSESPPIAYSLRDSSDMAFSREDVMKEEDFRPVSSKEVMAAASLAQRAAGRLQELGELTIGVRDADMLLEFYPSRSRFGEGPGRGGLPPKGKSKLMDSMKQASGARMRESDAEFLGYFSGRTPTGEIRIRGVGIEIRTPGVMANSETVPLKVVDSRTGKPARGLELIFMPEHGPFSKLVTDSKGTAALPMQFGPGLLRLESKSPQVLRIQFKDWQ